MNMPANKLRLGPLPRHETVKLTVALPLMLRGNLERYAALHAQTYGEPVSVEMLIPHMLEAFIARDRGFKKQYSVGSGALIRTPASNGLTGAMGADVLTEGSTKK